MRRVEWAESARDDLRDTIAYIAADNPQAARHVAERIFETVDLLAAMPVGRPGRVKGTYEKPVLGGPYVIAYHLGEETLTILRVIHARRDWPEGEWP